MDVVKMVEIKIAKPTQCINSKRLAETVNECVDAVNEVVTDGAVLAGDVNQDVDGTKTFVGTINVPDAEDGDNSGKAVNTKKLLTLPYLVRTTGNQNVDGVKTLLKAPYIAKTAGNFLYLKNTSVPGNGTLPNSTGWTRVSFVNNAEGVMGYVSSEITTDGAGVLRIRTYNNDGGNAGLTLTKNLDNTTQFLVPEPQLTGANTLEAATVGWVLNSVYPVGSIAIGTQPTIGTWTANGTIEINSVTETVYKRTG